jgi:hypothetical protein
MLLRLDLYATELNWYLREIISADRLAGTGLNHVIEENLTDGVDAGAWFTVIKNGKKAASNPLFCSNSTKAWSPPILK